MLVQNTSIIIVILFSSIISWGHARLTSPTPRNNNAGIKTGPCGGLARSSTPTNVQGGKMLTVNWEETINHPGKFIISLSMKDDLNFAQNILKQVVDTQDNGSTPHVYTTQVLIPDINCSTCTLQLIQSMEENPTAPTYYYSCADINITSSTVVNPPPPSPMPPSVVETSSTKTTLKTPLKVGAGGCGTIQDVNEHKRGLIIFFLMLPVLLALVLLKGLQSQILDRK
mgnify:CR=1 FL=1